MSETVVLPLDDPPKPIDRVTEGEGHLAELALGELRSAARLAAANLLALHLARVPGHETRLAQRRAQRFIVGHQRTGNPMTYRAGLTGYSAAFDVRIDIELSVQLNGAEGLLNDHAARFSAEKLIQRPPVDGHLTGALAQVYPRARGFAASGAVKGIAGCA